ncbi:MAG: CHAP domain-containing protein [Bilifractor sp.]|jgi:hypothetical protein
MATANDIVAKAESYVGVKESPRNSNNVIFNTDFYGHAVSGSAYKWCAAFVWDIFRMCDASDLFGPKTAGVAYFEAHTPAKQVGIHDGQMGDIVTFDWKRDGHPDHIGIIKSRNSDGSYNTIEGNTSYGNNSNGGEVMVRRRYVNNIHKIFRPDYTEATQTKTTEYEAPKGVRPLEDYGVFRAYNPNSGAHMFTANPDEVYNLTKAGWKYEGVAWHWGGNVNVYRLYNPNNGDHLYTTSTAERESLSRAGWHDEGAVFRSGVGVPVYRLYNPNQGQHMYTVSAQEKANLVKAGWKYEDVAFCENK